MAKGYNPTEYMYSSARIRALEIKIATKDRLRHLADAENADAAEAALSELGFELVKRDGSVVREETLETLLIAGYSEIASMETDGAVDFLKYQYDANNIKAIIKCASRGISPDTMLSVLGTVKIDAAKQAFVDKDYSVFPKNMCAAIADAEEAFAETANPQKIDFIIDRACFADMLDAADRSGIELAKKLVRTKIDLCNIMMTLRVIRMKLGKTAEGILGEVYISGGSFAEDTLVGALSSGEESFAHDVVRAKYESLATAIVDGEPLGDLERRVDNLWFSVAREAKYVSFGAEIAIGYIAALEYEVKNIRIILAGKDAGLSPEVIRERLRDCYA
jgi:V/A-type H+-transporting ATPase subunit C